MISFLPSFLSEINPYIMTSSWCKKRCSCSTNKKKRRGREREREFNCNLYHPKQGTSGDEKVHIPILTFEDPNIYTILLYRTIRSKCSERLPVVLFDSEQLVTVVTNERERFFFHVLNRFLDATGRNFVKILDAASAGLHLKNTAHAWRIILYLF